MVKVGSLEFLDGWRYEDRDRSDLDVSDGVRKSGKLFGFVESKFHDGFIKRNKD